MIHFTGPHLWNPLLLRRLRQLGIPTLHTLHDLDPHPGSPYGSLLHLWNRAVLHTATAILVHGKRYQERLSRYPVTHLPLLHLFLGYDLSSELDASIHSPTPPRALRSGPLPPSPSPVVLFFGRLEKYKGVSVLLQAWERYKAGGGVGRLILAGKGELHSLWSGALPPEVELRQHRIEDAEALALFREASLLVLPYIGATQSALIPAAYAFGKPVIASRSGALPEYVEEGRTGWLVPPGDAGALAAALAEALQSLESPERQCDFALNCGRWYTTQREAEEAALSQLYTSLRGQHEYRRS
ncbi:MAG: D-inositol 3-phosphate glycosyltransferase [Chloroflexi bacterium ADurb.Bin222]|nr:MAG: D-inositol 3-phosphate glycosyltransferase [Chloroflexi bacterium ADurb.Bin222]